MSTVVVEQLNQQVFIEEDNSFTTVDIIEETVDIIEVGIQGPAGANGADGADADKNFEYVLSGQTDVTVTHNLNKYPSITVIDSANDEVEGDYHYIDLNNVRLLFSSGFSGKAIFN